MPTKKKPATSWIPPRKVIASGLGAVVAFFIVTALQVFAGVEIPLEAATALVGGVATILGYVVPESVKDVVRQGDDFLQQVADERDRQKGSASK